MAKKKQNDGFGGLIRALGWLLALGTEIKKLATELAVPFEAFYRLGTEEGAGTLRRMVELAKDEFLAVHQAAAPDTRLWRPAADGSGAIEVNLDHPLRLPFGGAQVEWQKPGHTGWVRVERKDEKLFQNGREVILHLEPRQRGGYVIGHELRKALEGKQHVHPNVLDTLVENPHLWTEEIKHVGWLFSWAVGYRVSDGHLYVRRVCWNDGAPCWDYYWLGDGFSGQHPTLVLAS